MRGSPNHDPCHRGDDSTNFSYAPRTWARGRVKGERPIDSKPSVSLPPTLLSHVLLFPSLLLLSPPCIVISRPPVDAHPRQHSWRFQEVPAVLCLHELFPKAPSPSRPSAGLHRLSRPKSPKKMRSDLRAPRRPLPHKQRRGQDRRPPSIARTIRMSSH